MPSPRRCSSVARVFRFASSLRALPFLLTAVFYNSSFEREERVMRNRFERIAAVGSVAALLFVRAQQTHAQVARGGAHTPPDDTPKVNVGIILFADYSYQDAPTATDGEGNVIHKSSFSLTRGYVNVTGTLSHWFSFRVTPDIRAETGSGSSLSGSQTFRMKYGYGQVNFDDFATRGTWLRLGLQQTPWIDYEEGIYRYRFQGPIFADAEGFLTSSDYGASVHYVFPADYGDVHLGVYNGDGYQSLNDQNGIHDQKSLQIRASLRPAPAAPILGGLQVTGFYDSDHYFADARRERPWFIGPRKNVEKR
jgi:hypothetical protein